MQLRRAELPKHSHRQRLAAPGIAEALCWIFLSVSRAEDCGRARLWRADEIIRGSAERHPADNYSASKNSFSDVGAGPGTMRQNRSVAFRWKSIAIML